MIAITTYYYQDDAGYQSCLVYQKGFSHINIIFERCCATYRRCPPHVECRPVAGSTPTSTGWRLSTCLWSVARMEASWPDLAKATLEILLFQVKFFPHALGPNLSWPKVTKKHIRKTNLPGNYVKIPERRIIWSSS